MPARKPAASLFLSPQPPQVAVSLVQCPDRERELEVQMRLQPFDQASPHSLLAPMNHPVTGTKK